MGEEWGSLQIAQLAISTLTPLALFGLGLLVARSSRRLENLQHVNQTLMARRLEIFGQVGPALNRMLCFAAFVGRWKEITPTEMLTMKRTVDEMMYANRLLFSPSLFEAYRAFLGSLFAMYATVDADSPIRAHISCALGDRRLLEWWSPTSAALFASIPDCGPAEALQRYDDLSAAFRGDLYVTDVTRQLDQVRLRPDEHVRRQ